MWFNGYNQYVSKLNGYDRVSEAGQGYGPHPAKRTPIISVFLSMSNLVMKI